MSGPYYGDFPTSHTSVCMLFDSFASSTGAPSATSNFAAGDIQIYRDGGTTQRSSSAGIVVSTSFDGSTGLQMVTIDLSDNTDAGFYAAGHEYSVAVADVTIDAQTMRFWLGSFSIERAGGVLALLKAGTAKVDVTKWLTGTIPAVNVTGVPLVDAKYLLGTIFATPATAGIIDVNVKNIDNDAASASGTVTFPNATLASTTNITAGTIATVTNVTTVNGLAANVITATSIAADAITDAKVASDVTIASVTGAVGSVTGAVGSVTGAVGSVTGNVGGNVVGSVASVTAGVTLTSGERTSVADALLNRDMSAVTVTNARSPINALRALRNKVSVPLGIVYAEDDSTTAWQFTTTVDAAQSPITVIDPT